MMHATRPPLTRRSRETIELDDQEPIWMLSVQECHDYVKADHLRTRDLVVLVIVAP